jgi:hypothetical protein
MIHDIFYEKKKSMFKKSWPWCSLLPPRGKNTNYQILPLGGSIFHHKNVYLIFEFFYKKKFIMNLDLFLITMLKSIKYSDLKHILSLKH